MINIIRKNKLFIAIKPPFVWIYNNLYNVYEYLLIIKDRILNLFKEEPHIMTIDESIKYIIDNDCSISRFGDGELKIINGLDIDFQPYSEELGNRLKEVLQSNEKNHIVGIPDVFNSLDKYDNWSNKYWRRHLALYRKDWYRLLNNEIYINSFISRCYMMFNDKSNCKYYFKLIKNIWRDKDIVIIEGEESRLGIGNDLFDNVNSIQRILCPKKNAINIYNKILIEVKKISKEKLMILALGPTATILAYDLSKLGYQAIDIGHVDIEYEWFLQGAKEKVAIKNKYVGEAVGGQDVEMMEDTIYLNQIIAKVL